MEDIKHILVVSRITKCCHTVVRYGVSLARKYGAELSVLHTIDTVWLRGWSVPMITVEEEYNKEMKRTEEELDDIISNENKSGLVIKKFVKEGDPTEEILKIIEEKNIDLVILLAHGESRFEHFFFGRSNEEISRKIPCSILLIKGSQDDCQSG